MEKVSTPVDRHCRSKRTAKRNPAQTENLASRLPYLATSPAEIRTLWSKVGVLLGDEPTPLEREALRMEPDRED